MDASYHEPVSDISPAGRDMHRALRSLVEELEAIDWYTQRIEAGPDAELRDILAHNRDEEIEHAAMLLEWIRRRSPSFQERLPTYLFTTLPIVQLESAAEGHDATNGAAWSDGSLGVGSRTAHRQFLQAAAKEQKS